MRILISTWSLQVGGGEVLAMNLASELARHGHEVFLFNQRSFLVDEGVVKRLLSPQVRVLSMADQPFISFVASKVNALQHYLGQRAKFYDQCQQAYLKKCLKKYKIELINSHSTFSDQICAPLAQELDIPFVITEHGDYSQFILDGRVDFLPILQQAQYILTVSDYCRQQLHRTFNELPTIQTVHNGVIVSSQNKLASMRDELDIPSEAFVYGMVSRGVEKKGWKYAIQAFLEVAATAHEKPVRLVLVGGSKYLKQLQDEYALHTDIIFTGQVSDPGFYISGFDVGLLPTYFQAEALPLAVIEYIVSGKPSIATRVGGVPELIQQPNGPTGVLIDIDPVTNTPDVAQLKQAMQRYYQEPTLHAEHAEHAQHAGWQFTMEACAEKYENAFKIATNIALSAQH